MIQSVVCWHHCFQVLWWCHSSWWQGVMEEDAHRHPGSRGTREKEPGCQNPHEGLTSSQQTHLYSFPNSKECHRLPPMAFGRHLPKPRGMSAAFAVGPFMLAPNWKQSDLCLQWDVYTGMSSQRRELHSLRKSKTLPWDRMNPQMNHGPREAMLSRMYTG